MYFPVNFKVDLMHISDNIWPYEYSYNDRDNPDKGVDVAWGLMDNHKHSNPYIFNCVTLIKANIP